jgi:hypothetical protein
MPDLCADAAVATRRQQLVHEARVLLGAIAELGGLGVADPLTDPGTLTRAVRCGLLDAPHLKCNPFARGEVATRVVDGACVAIHPADGRVLREEERIAFLLSRASHVRR